MALNRSAVGAHESNAISVVFGVSRRYGSLAGDCFGGALGLSRPVGEGLRPDPASTNDVVQAAIRDAVGTLPGGVRTVAEYHLGMPGSGAVTLLPSRGKMLRAGFVLASARAVGGWEQDAVPGAVAVELLHNFSLLHDDIIDGDPVRRHRPAAWVEYGVPAALLAGDALLVLALRVVADTGVDQAARLVVEVLNDLMRGQSDDVAFTRREDLTVEDYWPMAEGKTGALVGGACMLGAVLAAGDPGQVEALGGFGRDVGVAFQCVDDVLGIWGDPVRTGKPVGTDLVARRNTLPVLAAVAAGGPAARRVSELYADPAPLDAGQLAELAELIELAGGRAVAEAAAAERVELALRRLGVEGLDVAGRTELAALATDMIDRDV